MYAANAFHSYSFVTAVTTGAIVYRLGVVFKKIRKDLNHAIAFPFLFASLMVASFCIWVLNKILLWRYNGVSFDVTIDSYKIDMKTYKRLNDLRLEINSFSIKDSGNMPFYKRLPANQVASFAKTFNLLVDKFHQPLKDLDPKQGPISRFRPITSDELWYRRVGSYDYMA
jgi:hypothetical protein